MTSSNFSPTSLSSYSSIFSFEEDSLIAISNQNLEKLKQGRLKTATSTKNFLFFKASVIPKELLKLEILASKTYLLFCKYAPALNLEIQPAGTSYSKFVGYNIINDLFFIEKVCFIEVKFTVTPSSIANFDKQELNQLLKTISWKFKERQKNKDSYFYNEWKFDEVSSLIKPLKDFVFTNCATLETEKREKYPLFLARQLILEAFFNLNNSSSHSYLLGTFETRHNVIIELNVFDQLDQKPQSLKRKHLNIIPENSPVSNVLNNSVNKQYALSTTTNYSTSLNKYPYNPIPALETDFSESITPRIYSIPSNPFCNQPLSSPLMTLPEFSANHLNFSETNELDQIPCDLIPFFDLPLPASPIPLAIPKNSHKNTQTSSFSSNYKLTNLPLEKIKSIYNQATNLEKIQIILYFREPTLSSSDQVNNLPLKKIKSIYSQAASLRKIEITNWFKEPKI